MKADTLDHIEKVRKHLAVFIRIFEERADTHDASKLEEPEYSAFEIINPRLKEMEYGSKEYTASLEELKPAIDHHYRANSHHPEHYANGVTDMSLFDILEMLADWKAASERYPDKPFEDSLKYNFKRFEVPRGLALVIANTAKDMGWIDHR